MHRLSPLPDISRNLLIRQGFARWRHLASRVQSLSPEDVMTYAVLELVDGWCGAPGVIAHVRTEAQAQACYDRLHAEYPYRIYVCVCLPGAE